MKHLKQNKKWKRSTFVAQAKFIGRSTIYNLKNLYNL